MMLIVVVTMADGGGNRCRCRSILSSWREQEREPREKDRDRARETRREFTKSYEQLRTWDRCKRMVGHADDDVLPPFRELTLGGPTDRLYRFFASRQRYV